MGEQKTIDQKTEEEEMFERLVVEDEIEDTRILEQVGMRIVDSFGADHWLFAWMHYKNFELLQFAEEQKKHMRNGATNMEVDDDENNSETMLLSAACFLDWWARWFVNEFLPCFGMFGSTLKYNNPYLFHHILDRLQYIDQYVNSIKQQTTSHEETQDGPNSTPQNQKGQQVKGEQQDKTCREKVENKAIAAVEKAVLSWMILLLGAEQADTASTTASSATSSGRDCIVEGVDDIDLAVAEGMSDLEEASRPKTSYDSDYKRRLVEILSLEDEEVGETSNSKMDEEVKTVESSTNKMIVGTPSTVADSDDFLYGTERRGECNLNFEKLFRHAFGCSLSTNAGATSSSMRVEQEPRSLMDLLEKILDGEEA